MKTRIPAQARAPLLPGSIQSSCGWCHSLNALERRFCHVCGHRAHLPRIHCDCERCLAEIIRLELAWRLAELDRTHRGDPYWIARKAT